jgi:flagella basal body P-ring formation protein FlgA
VSTVRACLLLLAGLLAIPAAASPALAGTAPVRAVTLRPFAAVGGAVVRLSDLWDGLDAGTDRALGPAPLPGARFTVESAQLVAIARQFGIEWHPASASDQAVVTREGRPMAREAVLALLRPALLAAGAQQTIEIDLPAFVAPVLPADGTVRPEVAQLDYDPATGRFTAVLSAAVEGAEPLHSRVAGTAVAMADMLVLARRVPPGTLLDAADLATAHVRLAATHVAVVELPEQARGMVLRHPVAPGQPIPLADLVRPPAVTRGALVAMQLDGPGITLTAQAQAMDDGAVGERIRVLNPASRAVLSAVIDAPGHVHVLAGSAPLIPAAGVRPPATFAEALPR